MVQNPKLSDFNTYVALVGGGITVQDNAKLFVFGTDGLTSLPGSLVLKNNPLLGSLPGLDLLRTVGGDLQVEGFKYMEQLHMEALQYVGGDFRFIGNELHGMSSLAKLGSIGGGLFLLDNPRLSTPNFPALRSVNTDVVIERNAQMTHVTGLWGLRTVRYLEVRDNPQMRMLNGFSDLRSAESVTVSGNPELIRLDMTALEQTRSLTITNNTKLPTCLAQALRVQAAARESTISGNLEPSTCP